MADFTSPDDVHLLGPNITPVHVGHRSLQIADLVVRDEEVVDPDGTFHAPLADLFLMPMFVSALKTFRPFPEVGPRITVGRTVLRRASWRARAADRPAEASTIAAWAAALGLPRRAFCLAGGQPKPVYIDFESFALTRNLHRLLGRGRDRRPASTGALQRNAARAAGVLARARRRALHERAADCRGRPHPPRPGHDHRLTTNACTRTTARSCPNPGRPSRDSARPLCCQRPDMPAPSGATIEEVTLQHERPGAHDDNKMPGPPLTGSGASPVLDLVAPTRAGSLACYPARDARPTRAAGRAGESRRGWHSPIPVLARPGPEPAPRPMQGHCVTPAQAVASPADASHRARVQHDCASPPAEARGAVRAEGQPRPLPNNLAAWLPSQTTRQPG